VSKFRRSDVLTFCGNVAGESGVEFYALKGNLVEQLLQIIFLSIEAVIFQGKSCLKCAVNAHPFVASGLREAVVIMN
jgi:hypothetical protein